MTFSMTAFSRGVETTPWGGLTCELRSVNHRYLEINPRLAEELRHLEPRIRELIGNRISRGRVDCTVRFQWHESGGADFNVDQGLADRLTRLAQEVCDRSPELGPLRVIDVLRWPGVVQTAELDSERLGETAMALVARTLEELSVTREREGGRLAELLSLRVQAMRAIVEQLQRELPALYQAFRGRIEQRLGVVREELDPARLEQELVLYIQKADVTEEVDRLTVHLEEVLGVLQKPGPIGRRLDFLMQELNREANTLGAKAVDPALTRASVELKVLIDQLREQVQNVE